LVSVFLHIVSPHLLYLIIGVANHGSPNVSLSYNKLPVKMLCYMTRKN
jgi:hypothetical protein